MKVLPERFRESQSDYYGKAGMSWHSSAVFYKPDMSCDRQYLERAKHGTWKDGIDELCMFFINNIVENDTTQDLVTTVGIIEAMLYRVRHELPECEEIYIVSDNAVCYQNELFPVILPAICKNLRFVLKVLIHPDADQ